MESTVFTTCLTFEFKSRQQIMKAKHCTTVNSSKHIAVSLKGNAYNRTIGLANKQ